MATGTGHWPGGARRALEGQCLAIPTYSWYQILSLNTILIPILNHPGQRRVTQASLSIFTRWRYHFFGLLVDSSWIIF